MKSIRVLKAPPPVSNRLHEIKVEKASVCLQLYPENKSKKGYSMDKYWITILLPSLFKFIKHNHLKICPHPGHTIRQADRTRTQLTKPIPFSFFCKKINYMVPANKKLLAGTVPANKKLLAETVSANKE